MFDPQAREYLDSAIGALRNGNNAVANRNLEYAIEEWPDQCDLIRALTYSRVSSHGGYVSPQEIAATRDNLATFDEILVSIFPGQHEEWFGMTWQLPLIPLILPLTTRGQVRAAYAAQLIESGRYDEAKAELEAARNERVHRSENASSTSKEIAAVQCLLWYRTSRWEDLIASASEISTAGSTDELDLVLAALGNAFGGAALAHFASHDAAQQKLRYAITLGFTAVSAWASLQLGLSYRTAGDEEQAQKALAGGMQYITLPELQEAMRNKNTKLRISAPDVIAARTSYWDPESEPDMADHQRQSSQEERKRILAKGLAELEAMDGMDGIKEQMLTISADIRFDNERRRRGMSVNPKTRHLIFTGPPGTGKTTIANLVVELYYGLGVIRTHTLVVANRALMIGAVEGESAKKTLARLEEARGGVLFIDEVYELVQDRGGQADPFGSEALTTLLDAMENRRDDLVIIIAGYPQETDRFLNENPGLKSRFSETLAFNTYSPDEMWRILTGMAKKEGRTVDPAVEERFKEIIGIMWGTDQQGRRVLDVAGNGRFARNVFEQAQGLSSRRLMGGGSDLENLSDEQFMELTSQDILGACANILKGFGLTSIV